MKPRHGNWRKVPWNNFIIYAELFLKQLGADGAVVGHTAQVTVKGYGGDVEIVVGVDADGVITGLNVGGANFSETAGLGAKAKEPAFTEQFKGLTAPLVLKDNVDSITGASITSGAVVGGVNTALDYIASIK